MTAWPLSGVATELLRRRPVSAPRAVVLTLQELVVCGVWRTTTEAVTGSRRGTRTRPALEPGTRPVPARPPLPALHARLRPLVPARTSLEELGARLRADRLLGRELVATAQADLRDRGLLTDRRGFLNRSLRRTPLGDAWHSGLEARLGQWRQALRQGGAPASLVLAQLAEAPGLVPLLSPRERRALDRALRDRRDDGDAGGSSGDGSVRWSDLDGLDGGLDGGLGGIESAVGDSGGGGDGGGDGGGGGGGD